MEKETIVLCGIPAAGKGTWRDFFLKTHPDHVLIHPDSIRKELTGNEEDQSRNDEVFKLAFKRMDAALKDNKSVIFDSCAQTRARRKSIIRIAKENGAKTYAVVFQVSLETAKDRNSKRDRIVPEFVLDKMFNEWRDPSEDEGFDSIFSATSKVS